MKRIGIRPVRYLGRCAALALTMAAHLLHAQTDEAETLPEEFITSPSSGAGGTSSPVPVEAGAALSASEPVKDGGGGFSLWDFFSRFSELRPPGDPNHPDKFRVTVGATAGYDSNVFTTYSDPIASATTGINGTAAYNFGSERLKLSSTLTAGAIYYDNRPGDNSDLNGSFNAAASYFVNRRLQISGSAGVFYASQPNPTLIGGVSRFSGDYSGSNLNISASYSLRPRLSARIEFHQNTITYADEAQNQFLGFTDQSYVFGFDYLMSPRLTLTTEYRYNPLSYYEADQDSTGQIFTVGFITSFSPRLKWTLQGGVEGRSFSSSTGSAASTYLGPFLESDLAYTFAPNSSLVGTLRYGTEPSGFAGVSVRETLRGSLAVRYAFTPRLSTDVGLTYEHDNYDQPGNLNDSAQEFYTGSLALSFQVNPALLLTVSYNYSTLQTEEQTQGYTRGVTSLGLQIIF